MKIKKIKVTNFRSLQNVELNFPDIKMPITIIGENNAGKSNIIKSILYGTGYKYLGEDGLIESDFFGQNTDQNIKIEISIIENEGERQFVFESGDSYRDAPKLLLDGRRSRKQDKDPIINRIFYYDFQQVANLLKIKTDFSYTPLGKIVKNVKDKFKSNLDLQTEMQTQIEEFINTQITNDQEYQKFRTKIGENLRKNLKNHSEEFDFKHTIQDVDKIINGLSFFVKENSDKPLMSVENFGSGFRTLLVFSIFEAISDSSTGGNVYIFEEPETFLHENFEEYFYELLCKLSQNNQVIITTHSKKFIDIFNPNSIIRLCNNQQTSYATKIYTTHMGTDTVQNINDQTLSDEDGNSILRFPDEYGSYIKAIEPNIGIIGFSEKVIIVEGPHDLLAYKYSFGKGLEEYGYISGSLGYLGINIICVHNKDLIGPLMYICSQLGTEAFVVFDSDLPVEQEIDFEDDYFERNIYQNKAPYNSLEQKWKQHYTKTIKLISIARKFGFGYQINSPKIEGVLNFEILNQDTLTYKNKSSLEIFNKIKGKVYSEIRGNYPHFITNELHEFIFGNGDTCGDLDA
ncbi:AAA family ATPase [Candidatus Gracilibacteria bacterium]|nr:AAA family ATPase [Candidatus Gracilibacteria bacterium]